MTLVFSEYWYTGTSFDAHLQISSEPDTRFNYYLSQGGALRRYKPPGGASPSTASKGSMKHLMLLATAGNMCLCLKCHTYDNAFDKHQFATGTILRLFARQMSYRRRGPVEAEGCNLSQALQPKISGRETLTHLEAQVSRVPSSPGSGRSDSCPGCQGST